MSSDEIACECEHETGYLAFALHQRVDDIGTEEPLNHQTYNVHLGIYYRAFISS